MTKKPRRASLGVALIARDAESTIGRCLDSIRPYVSQIVVGVDELSRDDTAKFAKRHGADLVVPIKVSDWHECKQHGRILVQHFAQAREQSFSYLDKSLDWLMWIDSDDVLEGAEKLPAVCDELMAANAVGSWQPYYYGNVQGKVSTLFHRERILRASVGWRWRYRVHEVIEPLGDQLAGWQIRNDMRFVHQDHERSEPAAARNLRLLEIDLEADPNDSRTLFYLGNQYFALQDYQAAVYWYERLLQVGKNPYECWQSAVYLSMSYQRCGAPDQGEQAAFRAIQWVPNHPEPYYQLALIAKMRGDADRCLYWTNEARTNKVQPPFFVFKNPLDDSFNSVMVASDALAMLGRVPEARMELEKAAQVLTDETVTNGIARYTHLEKCGKIAQAYVDLASVLPDDAKVALWESMSFSPDIKQFGRARDVVMPAMLRQRPNTQPRIVFWCGKSYEEWSPLSLNTTGIGGSETAVVEIARRFASAGWRVDVYNGAGRYEGVYESVGYWEPERHASDHRDIQVSWRQPNAWAADSGHHRACILWCHDLNYGPLDRQVATEWDKVLGVSQWHADYLSRQYGIEADYVPNGVNLDRFAPNQRREPMQVVYASSPDRGLERLLRLWPDIVKAEPGAQLKIAYGWQTFDKMAEQRPQMLPFKEHILRLIQQTPNVEDLGRLPQDRLAQLWSTSYAWAYPTDFLEVSCITAMEALAGGAVPVTSAAGAMVETIGGAGVVVTGNPLSRAWSPFYTQCLLGILTSTDQRMVRHYAGLKRAQSLTWDASFTRWENIVESLLNPDGAAAELDRELVLA